ncbi:MAG: hypothetical protein ACLUQ6_06170 [Alistipes onderdonkii]
MPACVTTYEPIVMLNYTFDISDRSKLELATALRFGRNGYSALTWQNGPDPRPDLLPLPAELFRPRQELCRCRMAAGLLAGQLPEHPPFPDWEQMYQTNYNQNDPLDGADLTAPGRRSNYMVEERHTDQLDSEPRGQFFAHLPRQFQDQRRAFAAP